MLMPNFILISDRYNGSEFQGPLDEPLRAYGTEHVIPRAELERADYIFIVDELTSSPRVVQLGAALALAVDRGTVVVLAYPGRMDVTQTALLREIVDLAPEPGPLLPIASVRPEFEEYFAVFGGHVDTRFAEEAADEVLARAEIGATQHRKPVAIYRERGEGAVYVVPVFLTMYHEELFPLLYRGVVQHRSGATERPPAFLAELEVFGEQALVAKLEDAERRLATLKAKAESLTRVKLILGHLSGQRLEDVVLEALNEVLAGTGFSAEDREDVRAEDFWIVREGEDYGIGEVRGLKGNVRLQDVGKLDAFRDTYEAPELPGLLVVNTFRGETSLEKRMLPVSEAVARRARDSNTLILRTCDLFELVQLKRAHGAVAHKVLPDALSRGGWLQVERATSEIHPA